MQSILVLAARHPFPQPDSGSGPNVAAYALGSDYHDVLPRSLEALALWMQAAVGKTFQYRAVSDSIPLLERGCARQAGLGWVGRNTCLISPREGSFILLAELLIDLPLQPSQPFEKDLCGDCQRCVEACPTACIRPDRTLDSGRCISYLTIENRGPISPELRPLVGTNLFGCDICQQVCPWNCKPLQTRWESPMDVPAPLDWPPASHAAELALSPLQFKQKFSQSPVLRARRTGYLRNLAVVIGNMGDTSAIPALALCLSVEPEPLVRAHCAWALGRFGTQRARSALEKAVKAEMDPQVQAELRAALDGGGVSG
jgi:epoxyqueuosine reductase